MLEGKRIIVTGAARGMGEATLSAYVGSGANVVAMDINEGADIVMVKPAMPYLDVINDLSQKTNVPIFAYQVSGEYSMLKMGIDKKIFDHNVIPETLISLFRAGSSSVITYFARWTAENYDNIS